MEQEKKDVLIKKFVTDLDKWFNDKHHSNNCVAHNEGQNCCLEELTSEEEQRNPAGRKFIIEWLKENLKNE